jgi:metal-sulfur cluster biosynthetic enzyme
MRCPRSEGRKDERFYLGAPEGVERVSRFVPGTPPGPGSVPVTVNGSGYGYDEVMITRESILESLKPIVDPEIRIGIVDLGLIYDVLVEEGGKKVEVKMTLTTPMCPYGPMILTQVKDVVDATPGIEESKVTVLWDPPWDPRTMASEAARLKLQIW